MIRGVDAAQHDAGERRAVRQEPLDLDERLDPHDARLAAGALRKSSQDRRDRPAQASVACAASASSRVRSSPSNPFMTDRMAIRAATPRQIPARETQLMNETKYWCCRART